MEQESGVAFPCSGCGQCCRTIGKILTLDNIHPLLNALVEQFPYATDQDGVCEKLNSDNTCSVYNERPLLCNVKTVGTLLGVPQDKWFLDNIHACNLLIKQAGLDEKYLISTT